MAIAPYRIKDALREKVHFVHMSIIKVSFDLDPGEEVAITVDIPPDETWFMVLDKHGDIPYKVFTHRCVKDGFEAFPALLISRDNIDLPYPIPFIAEKYLYGIIKNVSTSTEHFEMTIYKATAPRSYVEWLKREIKFEEEVKKIMVEEWEKLSSTQKRELVRKWMQQGLLPVAIV